MSKPIKQKSTRHRIDSLPFGKNLKESLKRNNMTLRQAAKLIGVNQSVIFSWCEGGMPHDLSAVLKLAKALNCSFSWLLTGEHENVQGLDLAQFFDIEKEPLFSGYLKVEASRLIPKKGTGGKG